MVRHFVFQRNDTGPHEWDPRNPERDLQVESTGTSTRAKPYKDCVYLGKVLAEMEERLSGEEGEIHCYLTWDMDTLPEYGPHVVAVLVGEECGMIPRYARHVRVVARVMGRYPFLGVRRWWPINKLTVALVMKYLRNWVLHARSWWRYRNPPASWPPKVRENALIVPLPWGSASLPDVPMKTIGERRDNYAFSGQIGQGGLPKKLSRGSLVAAVEAIERKHPHLEGRGTVKVNAAAVEGLADNDGYAERLMNSKVCLAPRGSVADTWRYFEGMKSGCVVLTNPLPREWYYRDAPVIQLDDWNELEGTLLPLLADETRMEAIHQETLRYWDEVCGERAVGRYLASALLHDGLRAATGKKNEEDGG